MSNQVTALRASGRSGIRFDIVQGLQQMLNSVNPYVAVFRRARDMLCDHGEVPDLRIRIIQAREDWQYSRPIAEEVAGLIVVDETEHFGPQDVILQTRDGTLQRIDEHHPSYTHLHYPLCFHTVPMDGVQISQKWLTLVPQGQRYQWGNFMHFASNTD